MIRDDENIELGLSAKKPNRGMTVEGHISSGSRNKGSQFISTTIDIEVANKYAHKYNCRIVEVDLNKLSNDVNVYDLSVKNIRKLFLKGITANNFASSSKEVLIEGFIPKYAIKLIKGVQ